MQRTPTTIVKYLYRSKYLTRWNYVVKYLQMSLVCTNYSRYYSILYVRGQHYVMSPVSADFAGSLQEQFFSMFLDNKELFLTQRGVEYDEDVAEIEVAGQKIDLNNFYGLDKLWYWLYSNSWSITDWALWTALGKSVKELAVLTENSNFVVQTHKRKTRKFIFTGLDFSELRMLTNTFFNFRPANVYTGSGLKRKKMPVRRKLGKQDARTAGRR